VSTTISYPAAESRSGASVADRAVILLYGVATYVFFPDDRPVSPGRLLFAGVITACVLVVIRIEESTLVEVHGELYEGHRRVPALLPRLRWWT